MTVYGLDLSLTAAGVAVIRDDGTCGTAHVGYSLPLTASLGERGGRIRIVANDVIHAVTGGSDAVELVAIEDMPYGAKGAGTVDRSGLWWAVVNELLRRDIPIVQVNVSTLKIYATGRGTGVGKDEVMLAVARRYPDAPITSNDEADAFALAAIASRLVGRPIEESLPQTHLRAMDKLVMPNG